MAKDAVPAAEFVNEPYIEVCYCSGQHIRKHEYSRDTQENSCQDRQYFAAFFNKGDLFLVIIAHDFTFPKMSYSYCLLSSIIVFKISVPGRPSESNASAMLFFDSLSTSMNFCCSSADSSITLVP